MTDLEKQAREVAEVTQADRDAALKVRFIQLGHSVKMPDDGHYLIQAFASHRAAALQSREGVGVDRPTLIALIGEHADFCGEVAGTCLGLAMSTDHPAPDEALMGLFEKSQALAERRKAVLSSLSEEG